MDPDAPAPDRPFYRRSGFWIGLGCILPLVFGGGIAVLDAHGRQYAAELRARSPRTSYAPRVTRVVAPPVPAEDNFCADPLIEPLFQSNWSKSSRGGGSVVDLLDKLDQLVRRTYPEETWHGPDSPCSDRPWGRTHPPRRSKSGPARSKEGSQYGAAWDRLSGKLSSGATDPPKTTDELARLLEVEAGSYFTDLEARLAVPQARVPDTVWLSVEPWEPHWVMRGYFPDLTAVIEARGQLALENDDPATAFRCAGILLRLASALHGVGPGNGSQIVEWRLTTQVRAAALIWMAARDRRWQEDQWRSIAGWTSTADFRQSAMDKFRWELESHMAYWRRSLAEPENRAACFFGHSYGSRREREISRLIPHGWFTAALAHADFDNQQWVEALEASAPPAWPLGIERHPSEEPSRVAQTFGYARFSREYFGNGGGFLSIVRDYGILHTSHEILRTTAALEQAFARQGSYPESLQELVPEWLSRVPLDLDAQPLRYALEPRNGRYRIWSVAANGVDDGGNEQRISTRKTRIRALRMDWPSPRANDWVWRYP